MAIFGQCCNVVNNNACDMFAYLSLYSLWLLTSFFKNKKCYLGCCYFSRKGVFLIGPKYSHFQSSRVDLSRAEPIIGGNFPFQDGSCLSETNY